MTLTVLYLATLIPFIALDALMLSNVMAPLFRQELGSQVLETPRWLAAGVFYAGYIGLVVTLAGMPALKAGVPTQALVTGALLGALAYGTYELTNMSVLKDWTWRMVLTDGIWGTVLTGVSAWIGVTVARMVA